MKTLLTVETIAVYSKKYNKTLNDNHRIPHTFMFLYRQKVVTIKRPTVKLFIIHSL